MTSSRLNKKVAVGLSGGVDSSVAAYLLKNKGYDVVGVYIQCWEARADGCASDEDRNDAISVASKLGIKFEYLNFIKEYKDRVIDHFYNEYKAGRTPNPDIVCNKEIKFGLFLDWALKNNFDYIATGHYARIKKTNNTYALLKGLDDTKDQSYFLYILDQDQLSKLLFPVGGTLKKDVRELARKIGLQTHDKPDSVGICFIGEVNIKEFLKKRIKEKKGYVLNTKGEVIGDHDGVWFYTLGQRHGFRISKYVGLPLYVVGKNVDKNELIVGFAKEVLGKGFRVSNVHWINKEPKFPLKCEVRVRHLGELRRALVNVEDECLLVQVDKPIFGLAPGQSAVFYKDEVVLGGGIIEG